jgi:putative colanic acid biosynthesis UDP-glucose lipid carrier transferase
MIAKKTETIHIHNPAFVAGLDLEKRTKPGYSVEGVFIRTADILTVLASGLFLIFFHNFSAQEAQTAWIVVAFGVLLSLIMFPFLSVYDQWRRDSRFREVRSIIFAWIAVSVACGGFFWLLQVDTPLLRIFFINWHVICGSILVFEKLSMRLILRKLRSQRNNIKHILVVGNDAHTASVIKRLGKATWTGYRVRGYFSDQNLEDIAKKRLGDFTEIASWLEKHKVDQIWIAMPLGDQQLIDQIYEQLQFAMVDIRYVPDISGLMLVNHSVSEVANMPVINLTATPLQGWNYFLKEAEDKVISFLILLLISPIMLLCALAVKLSSPGPVFYRQERVSWNGKTFGMLKFRSMPVDSEKDGVRWGDNKKKEVTKVGKFLRKTSLDELPQFINVLKGDMSIVGPRPERPIFVEEFKHKIPGYMQKHLMKAGITGLAQIEGWRGDTDIARRIEVDLHYINNWCLRLDLKIIFLTVFKGFVHKNSG